MLLKVQEAELSHLCFSGSCMALRYDEICQVAHVIGSACVASAALQFYRLPVQVCQPGPELVMVPLPLCSHCFVVVFEKQARRNDARAHSGPIVKATI